MSSRATALRGAALIGALALGGACRGDTSRPADPATAALPWDSVVALARGSDVTWRMWRGDPSVNRFVDEWVAPRLRERYGIVLTAVDGSGPALVNQLLLERETAARGSADLIWINGETFHNLRRTELLFGPWANRLPSARYVDSLSPIVMRDFEQDPAGFESPWGRVQFAFIYDTVRTPDPPRSVADLQRWIESNPGRFTHDQGFTGITFLKTLMYALGGGVDSFTGGFDRAAYATGSARVWDWLERATPAFWRGGTTYPPAVADLHRLFANGEVDFTMSNNHNEVVTKVRQGVLPTTARPLLLRDGTIANSHYLGIPFNAPNPAGAMVAAELLLTPEAQLEKLRPDVWADGTVLALDRLPREWADSFRALELGPMALPAESLARYARPEIAPEYHERMAADWRSRIRAQRAR